MHVSMHVCIYVCMYLYSGTPLIMTTEMWPPLSSGHFKKYQSMVFNINSPLKCGHPSNKDTFTGRRFHCICMYVCPILNSLQGSKYLPPPPPPQPRLYFRGSTRVSFRGGANGSGSPPLGNLRELVSKWHSC